MVSNALYYLTIRCINKVKEFISNRFNDYMGEAKLCCLWPNMGSRQRWETKKKKKNYNCAFSHCQT